MLKLWHHQPTRVVSRALRPLGQPRGIRKRGLLTLAIESSCDETAVAVLEKRILHDRLHADLYFNEKITSDNRDLGGICPIRSLKSHQENLAPLVQRAVSSIPVRDGSKIQLDFISVTRGPGMRSSLSTGLDTAKGLAIAYGIPLVAINHMQAHALTPRLVYALNNSGIPCSHQEPRFPFLSLLVSGGHTMLLNSESLTNHTIMANTLDSAVGNELDQLAREILPKEILESGKDVSYARTLEAFVFGSSKNPSDLVYDPPSTRLEEITPKPDVERGWSLPVPLAEHRGSDKARAMDFSFSGLGSAAKRVVTERQDRGMSITNEERKRLGYEAMRLAFELLASRVVFALDILSSTKPSGTTQQQPSGTLNSPSTLVVSGGVAANKFLRAVLRRFLDAKGYSHVQLHFPPLELCTDNAAMVAWAGMEMYEAGWESELGVRALRKWSLDPRASDGGVMGVGGWQQRKLVPDHPLAHLSQPHYLHTGLNSTELISDGTASASRAALTNID